jgi:Sulfotransferase family/SCP-2 sterol transfer family
MTDPPTSPPVFVLCMGRSGSTLLRTILDSHDQIACPPETNLAGVFFVLETSFGELLGDTRESHAGVDDLCRLIAEQTIDSYRRATMKPRWADKSLSSSDHADLLHRVYPDAQFICLFRNCPDTIASLLESTTYGFGAYSLEKYVVQYPANLVMAAAALWIDKVTSILEFEERHPEQCFRVRYEDVVLNPEETLAPLFSFLGIAWDERVLQPERFAARSKRSVRGDHKIWYTPGIVTTSVGRGATVPTENIPPPMRTSINGLHERLGYEQLLEIGDERHRGTQRDDRLPRPPAGARAESRFRKRRRDRTPEEARLESVRNLFDDRVLPRLGLAQANGFHTTSGRMTITLAEDPVPWLIDFIAKDVRRGGDPAVDCRAWSDAETFLAIASGECNPGTALRQARIRFIGRFPIEAGEVRADAEAYIDAFMDLVRP